MTMTTDSIRDEIFAALKASDSATKQQRAAALWEQYGQQDLSHLAAGQPESLEQPGRPERPKLVKPRELPKRSLAQDEGRAAFIHAIAHIEFNAINLALDAAHRFTGMPGEFYRDWLSVAADEARHFGWLNTRLQQLGYAYGDFDAHNGLWEMAEKTADNVLKRMALVPRVLEARGLDVTPPMIKRLQQIGDTETIAILERILAEEVPHVAVGSRWFVYCCNQQGVEPEPTFQALIDQYMQGRVRPPFNMEARLRAGFSEAEMAALGCL